MKLTLASRSQNYIKAYEAGFVQLVSQQITTNCIIAPEQVITDWRAREISLLKESDIEPILELQPEIVILGSSSLQQFPSQLISAAFLARGIGLEVMHLGPACRTFNVLLSEDRQVVAALLLNT
jgi:hypothetical protein